MEEEQSWKESYESILSQIRNNDESLKHLRIIEFSDHDLSDLDHRECLDYTAVMEHIQRFPSSFREALRSNTVITSIEVQPRDDFGEDAWYYSYDGEVNDDEVNERVFLQKWGRPSEVLARSIGGMSALSRLTITGDFCHIDDYQTEYRNRMVSFFLQLVPQITTLCFRFINLDQENATVLDEAFASGHHPALENLELVLPENHKEEEYFPFPTSLSLLSKLRSIQVTSEEDYDLKLLGFPVLHSNSNGLSTLQQIKLPLQIKLPIQSFNLDDQGALNLARTFQPNLTTIHVPCPANSLFFVRLADATKNLTELKIWASDSIDIERDDDLEDLQMATYSLGLSRLFNRLKASTNLKVLSVREFVWDDEHLDLLGHLLDESLLAMESLSLSFSNGEEEMLNDGAVVSLAASLGRHASLKHLMLEFLDEPPISDESVRRAHTELAASPSLSSYEGLMGAGYADLCELVRMIDAQSSITKLVCTRGQAHLESEKELLNALRRNYTLTNLQQIGNLFGREPTDVVDAMDVIEKQKHTILTLNSHGRRYMAEDRGATEKGVALLAEIAAQPISYQDYRSVVESNRTPKITDLRLDCLFFHLSENPSLCDPTP